MLYLTKQLKIKSLVVWLFLPMVSFGQTLTLQQVYDSAKLHYPLLKQKQIIEQTKNISIDNLSKGYLPQIALSGQASYQTDVTKVNIPIPTIQIDPMSKDQYKLVADFNQLIYDGGLIKQQKQIQQLNAATENEKLAVEFYKLKERVSQVYLSILLIDEQLKQTDLLKADIATGIKKVQAQVDNGVAFKSNVNVLKAQLLQVNQKQIELAATRKGLLDVLAVLMQQPVAYDTKLQLPFIATNNDAIARPELDLLSSQNKLAAQQAEIISAKNMPKASAFVQGGYGRPGLNMLNNSFQPFAIGGIRLSWNLGNLYTEKKEKQLVNLSQQTIQVQKDNLLLNITAQVKQQQAEIEKMEALIKTDSEIIDLRTSVKNAANAQLDNGVITANDYLREVNAEDQARQALILHKLQLLQSQINLQLIKGQF